MKNYLCPKRKGNGTRTEKGFEESGAIWASCEQMFSAAQDGGLQVDGTPWVWASGLTPDVRRLSGWGDPGATSGQRLQPLSWALGLGLGSQSPVPKGSARKGTRRQDLLLA